MILEEAYVLYRDLMFARILRNVKSWELAEDLTQEVFLHAMKGWNNFHGEDDMRIRWLHTIARNLVADYNRKKHEFILIENPISNQDVESEVITRLELEQTVKQLKRLSPDQMKVVYFRALGFTVKEVALRLKISPELVRTTTFRARDKLKWG